MSSEIELTGLHGANPLAMLAALGTFVTLEECWSERAIRLHWRDARGAWRPVVSANCELSEDAVVAALDGTLTDRSAMSPFEVANDLNVPDRQYRQYAQRALTEASSDHRREVDFVAAFGCDAVAAHGVIRDTAFRTMSGAGHQHFLGFMRQLVADTKAAHLRHALFESWRYSDTGPSLRWDANDDRRYALRWREPSGDPIRAVRGANRLAVEGLRLLPTVPVGSRLETTGVRGTSSRDTFWTWPIWTPPASRATVSGLLALASIQTTTPDRSQLIALGIMEVYRSRRVTEGKFRNFSMGTPA
jgi:hypothetical protein